MPVVVAQKLHILIGAEINQSNDLKSNRKLNLFILS